MTEIKRLTNAQAHEVIKEMELDEANRKAIDFCLLMSVMMWAGYIDKRLACVWGVVPPTLMSNQAYLWLHTTDLIKEHQFILVRHSQLVINEILKDYPSIVGHATIGASKSIRWLKWLGAKFGAPMGTSVPFRITRSEHYGEQHG